MTETTAVQDGLPRIERNLEDDPYVAIGSCRELVETVCKHVLEDYGVAYERNEGTMDLCSKGATALDIDRESVPDNAKASRTAKRILQKRGDSRAGLTELRNEVGSGHGKTFRSAAQPRHARLALNATRTVVEFILDTWTERKRRGGASRPQPDYYLPRFVLTSLGIDLAAQPANTAACLIEWGLAGAEVRWVRTGAECSDDGLVDWMAKASEVGIDAPFGWPATLVGLLPQYLTTGRWPVAPTLDGGRLYYDRLRYRETDRSVNRLLLAEHAVSLWPLSVSSDSIAVVAWRCAHLLHRHAELAGQEVDRLGDTSQVFETYPAAALTAWSLPRRLYKSRAASERKASELVRVEIVKGIERAGRGWLNRELTPWARQAFIASDHALDAFISALVARAAAQHHTTRPRDEQLHLARSEGWIHVPRPEALEALGPAD